MRRLGCVAVLLFGIDTSSAQLHDILWETLFRVPGQPEYVVNLRTLKSSGIYDSLPPDPIKYVPIKMNKELFFWGQGTGRLFQMHFDSIASAYTIHRIDSTQYIGYNCAAFPFAYQGKIFNLGGYGYWRRNGLLRYFNQASKQWDVIKLNREIPLVINTVGDLIWLDSKNDQIYLLGYREINDGLKQTGTNTHRGMVLNLQKGEWRGAGLISPFLRDLSYNEKELVAANGKGILIRHSYHDFYLLSFAENKIYRVKEPMWDHFTFPRRELIGYVNFFIDSTLYSYNTIDGKMDSLVLRAEWLIDTHEPIFIQDTTWKNYWYASLLLVLLVPALMYRKRWVRYLFVRHSKAKTFRNGVQANTSSSMLQLDVMEVQLLDMLYKNSASDKSTTIEEINTVLGLAKRNVDTQKKVRSDSILSINHKLGIRWDLTQPVIDKKRSEFDKRSYDYYITPALLSQVQAYINEIHKGENS